jgi:glucoamylase
MLRVHEDKAHAGGSIASLAIPWGEARGDHDGGGYHLIWARDLVEIAGALLAVGLTESARLALLYLKSTQEDSGHWPQNMWLDGKAYWRGVQLDEAGLPILLADALDRHGALGAVDVWPMVRRAASYIVRNGPVTPEDRWEERAGYSPFTLAVEVAALLVAASFAERRGCKETAEYLRETADYWNAQIERWTYVTGTKLAERLEIGGYYVRLAPPRRKRTERVSAGARATALKNHPVENGRARYQVIVSPDALALVRFGLRRADDAKIVDTVRAIDAVLCSDTPTGPVWHRFTGDHYGEHEDGSPFDGDGIGRGWPLLAGERAHYEVARGNLAMARTLRRTMIAQASAGGLIPEQVWDADDIPACGLYKGRPTGSAMPLVWAHAEFLKLCRSIEEERVFDSPPLVRERYAHDGTRPKIVVWRANAGEHRIEPGMTLRVERRTPFALAWRIAGDERRGADDSRDTGVGIAYVDLPTRDLPAGAEVRFATRPAQGDGAWSRERVVRVGGAQA